MQEQHAARPPRKLRINLLDLELAFGDSSEETRSYLNVETGRVVAVTDEVRTELERLDEEIGDADDYAAAFAVALEQSGLADWLKDDVAAANEAEMGLGSVYVKIPRQDSRAGYGDMEAFIETVGSGRIQERLSDAIGGRGPFRRFKDIIANYPDEETRWYAFRDARERQRMLDWLEEEGIELVSG